MATPSLRVYQVSHQDGRVSAYLMRRNSMFFDNPLPAVYARDAKDALRLLTAEVELLARSGQIGRYLWTEDFTTHSVRVEIHPQTQVERQAVVGKTPIQLRMTYAACQLDSSAWQLMLPRYDWWILTEDQGVASDVLSHAVSAALLGEEPKWIYDFRREGPETVIEWTPDVLRRGAAYLWDDDDNYPIRDGIADDLLKSVRKSRRRRINFGHNTIKGYSGSYLHDPPASLIIVGPSGSGKTAWLEGLALELWQQGKDRENYTAQVWQTSADRLLAGMVYLGMWQARIIQLIEEIAYDGDYLSLGRLIDIVRPQSDGTSIADLLLPAIIDERISIIAEATKQELAWCRERAPELVDRLQPVWIRVGTSGQMADFLSQFQGQKAPHLHPEGLSRLIRLLGRYEPAKSFPGKAVRFYDWLRTPGITTKRVLLPKDVSAAYARYSGLPASLISEDEPLSIAQITTALQARVIGQDTACTTAAGVIARLKAGLHDPQRPIGSLLLVGPTGVGKTELAKQLARYLFGDAEKMHRLDMSEYLTAGSAHRLLRVGPGVDSLAERVRRAPLSLVLLDEIEKAHPAVFDVLLGVLDEGRLTDDAGALVSFQMTVIIMTSNLGASDRRIGLSGGSNAGYESAVRQHFRPEFFNRIDEVIPFQPLDPTSLRQIVELLLDEARKRPGMVDRHITLTVTDDAKDWLVERGYDPKRGARPLQRVIETHVITPIAIRLARDPALKNQTFCVEPDGQSLGISTATHASN